jgi:hypothetical protein
MLSNGKDIWSEHHDRIIKPDTEVFPIWLLQLRAELFKHPEKFVDANMNRIGDPYGEIRDLFGQRDKNDDESLLHNVTKQPRKKSKKKNSKEGTSVDAIPLIDNKSQEEGTSVDPTPPLVEKNIKSPEKKTYIPCDSL